MSQDGSFEERIGPQPQCKEPRCPQVATLSAWPKKEFADLFRNGPIIHSYLANDKLKIIDEFKRRCKDKKSPYHTSALL